MRGRTSCTAIAFSCICLLFKVESATAACDFAISFASTRICGGEKGIEISLSEFSSQESPLISYSKADSKASYTLLMLDPDAPSAANPLFADWIHLLYCNIPGKELKKGVNGFGESYDTFFGYHPPTPPKGTGFHRYQILLLRQRSVKPITSINISKRSKFDRKKFIELYHLHLVNEAEFRTRNK